MPADARQQLIDALQAVLDSPNTSAKALQAKVSAAHQLARLQGLVKPTKDEDDELENLPDDPIAAAGLDELAPVRRRGPRGFGGR
jgi:hypothetical protein